MRSTPRKCIGSMMHINPTYWRHAGMGINFQHQVNFYNRSGRTTPDKVRGIVERLIQVRSLRAGTFSIRAATVAGPGNSILPAPPKNLMRSLGMSTMASSLGSILFSFLSLLFALAGSALFTPSLDSSRMDHSPAFRGLYRNMRTSFPSQASSFWQRSMSTDYAFRFVERVMNPEDSAGFFHALGCAPTAFAALRVYPLPPKVYIGTGAGPGCR
jgi:hypothetical protein